MKTYHVVIVTPARRQWEKYYNDIYGNTAQSGSAMTRCILVDCELQKPKVTWKVIEGFAGSKRLKCSRQRAACIVR